jgi:hypothetical protein
MWRNNVVMYVTVPYNTVLFSILYFLTSQSEFDFGIAYVYLTLHENQFTLLIISRSVILRMRTVSDKIVKKNLNTHFIFNSLSSRPENRHVYETL